jgi:hypothetical protein
MALEGGEAALQKRWDLYSTEWNDCLDGVDDDLIGRASPSVSREPGA